MKIAGIVAVAMLMATSGAFAADQTWSGTISDKMCATDHKDMRGKMSDRDCTLACAKGGTPFALVSGGKVYALTGHEADLREQAGHAVKLTGELKGDTIRVSKVELPKQ
jgi:hypothetical protein